MQPFLSVRPCISLSLSLSLSVCAPAHCDASKSSKSPSSKPPTPMNPDIQSSPVTRRPPSFQIHQMHVASCECTLVARRRWGSALSRRRAGAATASSFGGLASVSAGPAAPALARSLSERFGHSIIQRSKSKLPIPVRWCWSGQWTRDRKRQVLHLKIGA